MQSAGEQIRRIGMTAIECVVRRYSDLEASMASNDFLSSRVNWFRRRSVRRADPHGMLRIPRRKRARLFRLLTKPGILETMEQYRQSALSRLLCWLWWLLSFLLHPTRIWKAAHFWNKIMLWICFYYNRFTSRYREKKVLIEWVRSRVRNYSVPDDFSTGWTDGILLCALLDSMYPGSCPRYDLLHPDNSLSNTQLAFLLIEKYTPVRLDITAEEVVEGQPGIKKAIRSIVAQLKLISAKRELQKALGRLPNTTDEAQYASKQECFAKGMGLILAVRGRRATFNVFTRPTHSFCIVIEIRGPDGSVSKETVTNKSSRKKVLRLNDYRDENGMQTKNVLIEYEIFPGKVAVKYRPALTGKHELSIIWHGQHVMGSPYVINVEDSRDDDEPLTPSPTNSPAPSITNFNDVVREELLRRAQRTPHATSQSQPKMRKRRVICRIIKCNGKEFVIDGDDREQLKKVLVSISNNKGASKRKGERCTQKARQSPAASVPVISVQDTSTESVSTTPLATPCANDRFASSSVTVGMPVIVVSAASPPPDGRETFDIISLPASEHETNAPNSVPELSRSTCEVATHVHEVSACASLPHKEHCVENILELSIPPVGRHEAIPQTCDISSTSHPFTPPSPNVALGDFGSSTIDMTLPLQVGSAAAVATGTSRCLQRQLPVIAEETEKRLQPGMNTAEDAQEIETECSTKYEFRIHRSSVTVNIRPTTSSESIQSECLDANEISAINSKSVSEENGKTVPSRLLEREESVPIPPCPTVRRKLLKRQTTACDGSLEDEIIEPQSQKSYPEVDTSASTSVKRMIKSWERKQKEQESLADDVTYNVPNPRPPMRTTKTLPSLPEVSDYTKFSLSKVCEKGEEPPRGIRHAVNMSVRTNPDVYEEVKVPAPHGKAVQQSPRCCIYRTKQTQQLAPTYPSTITCKGDKGTTNYGGSAYRRLLTSVFPHDAMNKRTMKWDEQCKDYSPGSLKAVFHKVTDAYNSFQQCIEGKVLRPSDRGIAESPYKCKGENLLYEIHQEYIDDEISSDDTLLLDRYRAFQDTKLYNDVIDLMYRDNELHELLKTSPSHPEKCTAIGSRLYFGQVGVQNRFQVDASRGGTGPLSVGIQGPTEGSVTKVSITYSGLGNYTVKYKVIEPGFYIINVRWADWPIPDSPFMCKISA